MSLRELKGRPVLLDFWTFCCINCIHVLPDLKFLEEKFGPRGLAVIGVHSNKFPHEASGENVKQAVLRYDIRHPVVVDEQFAIWQSFAVRAWPSFVLLNGEGDVVFAASGEGKREILAAQIEKLLHQTQLSPVVYPGHTPFDAKLDFRFPSKVHVARSEKGVSIYVADTGNHRVVVLNEQGRYLTQLGDGELREPNGLLVVGQELLVCDSGNHRILGLSLEPLPERKSRTLAGAGDIGYLAVGSVIEGAQASINSPWDLCLFDEEVAVACAGSHQLALVDPKSGKVTHLAGTGREDIVDGPAATFAALAQPSGICQIEKEALCFADSEVSAIRLYIRNWNNTAQNVIVSLVGQGLFEYGHQDGSAREAKLQHPLGCCYSPLSRCIYVADSYNNAIRVYSCERETMHTLKLPTKLAEPGGVCFFEGKIFVADTNHHRILAFSESEIHAFEVSAVEEFRGPFGLFTDGNVARPNGAFV